MQTTLCCTHCGRLILHNGNRILWHHTLSSTRTASVSLPPVPLPENSSVDVEHLQTRQKSHVFPLPLHFEQQLRLTHATPPFADSPQTRLPPNSPSHIHAVRKHHAVASMTMPHTPTRHHATRRKQRLDTQNRLPQTTTAPPSSEAGLVANNQTISSSSPPSAMHEVPSATCIICDARALNE
ncbi:hypothetical protein TcCL_Unassigned00731 [Trypanosoma cruzi]|nr:hypothetical protein TcCL_Unassigned00731 [Trypanosoma cruzi]